MPGPAAFAPSASTAVPGRARGRRAWMPAGALTLAAVVVGCSSGTTITEPPATSPTTSAVPATTAGRAATTKAPATTAGDTGGSSSGGAEVAACELITEADATEAFGEPAGAGTQDADECWWSTKGDLKTINVIRRTGDVEEWRSGLQGNSSWEPVDLGDEGYAGKVLDSVTWRVGDTTYEVNVVYSTKGDPEAVVKDLSEKVAARV